MSDHECLICDYPFVPANDKDQICNNCKTDKKRNGGVTKAEMEKRLVDVVNAEIDAARRSGRAEGLREAIELAKSHSEETRMPGDAKGHAEAVRIYSRLKALLARAEEAEKCGG